MRELSKNFVDEPLFKKWRVRALRARQDIVENGKPNSFRVDVWRELKKLLIEFHNGKCMYCEGNYTAGAHDDAEHYRPKGGVTAWDKTKKERCVIDHPGYYWLAYEWQNILLACTKCNSPHSEGMGGRSHLGKLNEFPINASNRTDKPSSNPEQWWDDLEAEEPLLLHPYFDKPEEHFKAERFGILHGITERGRATIAICDLNRPSLCAARLRNEDHIRLRVPAICNQIMNGRQHEELLVQKDEEFSLYLGLRLIAYAEKMLEEASGNITALTRESSN